MQGVKFGADWLGKLKMVLQCTVLVAVLAALWWRTFSPSADVLAALRYTQIGLIYAMILATILSGLQYVARGPALDALSRTIPLAMTRAAGTICH